MGRSCYLCDYKEGKRESGISLHRFPKDAKTRDEWIHICDLNKDVDDIAPLRICSQHFSAEHFWPTKQGISKPDIRMLKVNAVPSVAIVNRPDEISSFPSSSSFRIPVKQNLFASQEQQIPEPENIIVEEQNVLAKSSALQRNVGEPSTKQKKRKFKDPRVPKWVEHTIAEKSKKIKTLQDKNRYLERKITKLKQLIKELRKKPLTH